VKERVRENRIGAAIDTLCQDVRYSLRGMRRDAGFTVVAVLTLGIGIGANTALFGTLNAALLRPIPFPEADRLVSGVKTIGGVPAGSVSRVDYFDYREQCRSFEDLAALTNFGMQHTVTGEGAPQRVQAGYVTWNLFRTLGVEPVVGRHFLPEEEQPGAGVVLVSHGLWQRRWGGTEQVVGDTLDLDGAAHTVVGVMPRGFQFLYKADVWRLVDRDGPFDATRDSHSHVVIGRLRSGVSIEQAQDEADAISAALAEQFPDTNKAKKLVLTDLHTFMVFRAHLKLLLLAVTAGLVLLIACGNVAGLLLARGQRRLGEIALRSALGAPRRRLIRQLVTESLVLTALAGGLGVVLAYLSQGFLFRLLPTGELGMQRPAVDSETLLFAIAASIATGLVVGVVPALRATSIDVSERLGAGGRASEAARSTHLRSGLAVLQVAVSVVLLVGAGLLIQSLQRLSKLELGFDPGNVLSGYTQILTVDYPSPEERNVFFTSVLDEVEALPGVVSASMVNKMPIRDRFQDWAVWPADQPPPTGPDSFSAMARWVAPDYFETLRIPLRVGRDISATDLPEKPLVIVVSESVARTLFPGQDPIGRMVNVAGWRTCQVVGVVADARLNTLRGDPDAAMYMSAAQMAATRVWLVVRSSGDPAPLAAPIRRILQAKNKNVSFDEAATMEATLGGVLADFRVVSGSLSVLAAVALLLTAIGLYGVLAYHVSQRTHEIGIRIAMGAGHHNVLALIIRKGLALAAVGLLIGLAGAYGLSRLLEQLLFETRPLDPGTYLGAASFLGIVALLACLLPAWQAARVDPVVALRTE